MPTKHFLPLLLLPFVLLTAALCLAVLLGGQGKFRLIRRASAGQGGKRSGGEGKIRLNLRGVPLSFVLTFFFAG